MTLLKRIWDFLVECGEEVYEHRRKTNIHHMY